MMSVDNRGWLAWTVLTIAIAISWFALEAQKPPDAKPADASLAAFSSGRAMAHVAEIAQAPHPMGSPEAERVREVVVKRLAELGLTAEIQAPKDSKSGLRNVLARRKGRGPAGKKALLLCAHYDSVASGPGAGDDASGVAVVLETMRALAVGPPLDRDVIVLIDDGEEGGLSGANLFVDEHPWAREVGVVLNFDARGISGPSFMFETSDKNGWLIRQFALASPRPVATSMSMDVYRIMPNSTNLTVFKRAGMAGLNFAFAGGSAYYHTSGDTPANLDPRSLQHQGDSSLALARHLGALGLDLPSSEDVIYASLLGRTVLSYPQYWAMPIAVAVAVVFLVVTGVGLWSGRATFSGLGAGIVTWLIAAAASIALATTGLAVGMLTWLFTVVAWITIAHALWVVPRDIRSEPGLDLMKFDVLNIYDVVTMMMCSAVVAAVILAIERRAARRRSLEDLALGALLWWLALVLATAWWLPNSSYLFAWPTLFALLGLGGMMLASADSVPARFSILLGAIPALVLIPPIIRNAFDGLGPGMAGLSLPLVALFLGAILPLLEPLVAPPRRQVAREEHDQPS
jgi:Peptidase family M28